MLISIICSDQSRFLLNKNHIITVELEGNKVTIRTTQSSQQHVSNWITCSSNKVAVKLYNFIQSANRFNSTFDMRKML